MPEQRGAVARKGHRRLPRDPRFRVGRFLIDTPWLGDAYVWSRAPLRRRHVDRHTDVVIDGFPRSANTYALYAFELATDGGVVVKGHTHSAVTVIRAARRQLPTMVMIRDPRDVVASLVQLAPGLRAGSCFAAYSRYYNAVLRDGAPVFIADFGIATRDFGLIMRQFNEFFGSAFPPYDGSDDAERAVRERIDDASLRRSGRVREQGVARPSSTRAHTDDVLRDIDAPARAQMERAYAAYERVRLLSPGVRDPGESRP